MKTQNAVWKKILKVSLAGTFAATPLLMGASAAQAAPPRHAPAYGYRDKDHKNDKDNKKDKDSDRNNYQSFTGQVSNVKGQQFDLRVGGTTYNVYASSRLPNGISQNDSVRVYGERYGNNDIRNANVSIISNRSNNRWDNKRNDNNNRWDNNKNSNNNSRWNNYQKFTGKVSNVKGQQFDLRVGNTVYNVYASSRLPNNINQGDVVRVYGERYGNNDIRNANVSVISNRSNNRWDDNKNNRWDNNKNSNNNWKDNNRWNNYQSFTGKVSNVKGQQFDLRVGGTIYNVYASSRLPNGISQNDSVRVYGERYGNNDIRNANVSIISNNSRWDNNRNDNNNRWNNYQTFTGTVTNVKSSSEFDVRIGSDTYNVYTSGNNERRVSKNDVVRIYGQRHGNNDIRNANVVVIRNR